VDLYAEFQTLDHASCGGLSLAIHGVTRAGQHGRCGIKAALLLGVLGCVRVEPSAEEFGEERSDTEGETGDGDGEPGDGDGEPGDGDGEPGDGDGEPGDGLVCQFSAPLVPYEPALAYMITHVDLANAPGFVSDTACWTLAFCAADQDCSADGVPLKYEVDSTGSHVAHISAQVVPLRLTIRPKLDCDAPMKLDTTQSFEVHVLVGGNDSEIISVRLPCVETHELDLWLGYDGSTFWSSDLTDPAALWADA
jgi:hypothetical protein